jgi:hypothetical protein
MFTNFLFIKGTPHLTYFSPSKKREIFLSGKRRQQQDCVAKGKGMPGQPIHWQVSTHIADFAS